MTLALRNCSPGTVTRSSWPASYPPRIKPSCALACMPRRRAARVSAFIDHLRLAAGSLIAVAAAAATLLYVPLSDRVSIVVLA